MTRRSTIPYVLPAIILMGVPQLALAQSSSSLSGLYACETVSGQQAQLECFLTETAKLREARTSKSLAPSVSSQALEAPKTAPSAKPAEIARADDPEKFIPIVKDNTPKKRTLTIQSAAPYGGNGYTRFTLANGEVWQQTETGKIRLGRANPDKITIKKGVLGSFRARVNDKAPSIRVKRVK